MHVGNCICIKKFVDDNEDQNGAWESDLFEEFIPNLAKQMINSIIPLPRENMGTDSLAWGCTSDGCFGKCDDPESIKDYRPISMCYT